MKLLVLGGTRFVGRVIVEEAIRRGHELTIFHRGESNPGLFPNQTTVQGDREMDLARLGDEDWDAVIDTCGYVPRIVRYSVDFLRDRVKRYVFISTISVFKDTSTIGIDENGTLFGAGDLEDPATEQITGESYGPLKVLCEDVVRDAYARRALIVRPGLVVGPHDPTDRFTYWVSRVAEGGEVLVPGRRERPNQFIDARDLAHFTLGAIEANRDGAYNATGPSAPHTMNTIVNTCRDVAKSDARFEWVDEAFLAEHKVEAWSHLPLWLPESPDTAGFFQIDCSHGIAHGLAFRPLSETVRDTLAWTGSRPDDYEWKAGLDREREQELLSEWKRTKGSA
ncbi:MAG: SDR family oxidoreductase [Gemmatimonadetes bacterium]|nr:SDR family oxidoreductase [Gemmatimonadota bacterium]